MLDIAGRRSLLRVAAAIEFVAAACGAQAETLPEIIAARQLAQDWLEGKVQADNPPKVLYTGLPFTMRVTSHQAANSPAIVGIVSPALRLLEKMSNGKIIAYERYDRSCIRKRAELKRSCRDCRFHPMFFGVGFPDVSPDGGDGASGALSQHRARHGGFLEELYDKYFRHDVEKQGVVMGRLKAGSGTNLCSMKPIRTVADLAGLKIGVAGDMGRRNILALGGTPVVMTSNQVAQAFASGSLDAVLYPDAPAGVYGIAKTAKYRTALNSGGHYNAEYCLSRKLSRDALQRDLQLVLNAWLRAQAQAETQILYSVGDARSLEKFRASGLEIIKLDADQRRLWASKTSGVVDEWIAARRRPRAGPRSS